MVESLRRCLRDVLIYVDDKEVVLGWDTLKFDEATKSLAVNSHPLLTRDQQSSTYDTLQSMGRVGWVLRTINADGAPEDTSEEIRIPRMACVMLGSKNAGALWDGIFCQEYLQFSEIS